MWSQRLSSIHLKAQYVISTIKGSLYRNKTKVVCKSNCPADRSSGGQRQTQSNNNPCWWKSDVTRAQMFSFRSLCVKSPTSVLTHWLSPGSHSDRWLNETHRCLKWTCGLLWFEHYRKQLGHCEWRAQQNIKQRSGKVSVYSQLVRSTFRINGQQKWVAEVQRGHVLSGCGGFCNPLIFVWLSWVETGSQRLWLHQLLFRPSGLRVWYVISFEAYGLTNVCVCMCVCVCVCVCVKKNSQRHYTIHD